MHDDKPGGKPPVNRAIAARKPLAASPDKIGAPDKKKYEIPRGESGLLPEPAGLRAGRTCWVGSVSGGEWAEQDSNLRRISPVGLQPTPFGRSGIRPSGGATLSTAGGGIKHWGSGVQGQGD